MVTSCPDCNGKVSDSATVCPHCGKPVKAAQPAPAPQPAGGAFLDPKANAKSLKGILVTFFVLVGIIVTVWFVMARATGAKTTPLVNAITGKQPILLDDVIKCDANYVYTKGLTITQVPGHLTGSFHVQGKGANIKGATDDTLVGFHILGPNNEKTNVLDHPGTGNFSIRVTSPGIYKLIFSNAGILRSSAREVTVKGKYQPE